MPLFNTDKIYKVDKISEHTYRIIEPGDTIISMFLICGSEKAVLIDTAFGLGDLAGLCARLTDKPVTLFCSHAHPDHVLGNWQFESGLLNSADNAAYAEMANPFMYVGMAGDPGFREMIERNFPGVPMSTVTPDGIKFCPVTDIKDGDVIDLGDRKLEVLAVPGHTPGSLALIDRADGIIYTGDGINQYPWLFFEGCASLEEYREMLIRTLEHLDGIDTIYHGHCSDEPMQTAEITAQIGYLDDIIAGKLVGEPCEMGPGKCLRLDFDKWHLFYDPENIHKK